MADVNRISPTLSLYLARHFIGAFAAVLGVITGLIVLFDMIELLRRTMTIEAAGFDVLFSMALLKLPHTVQDTLPFVVMMATMFALFRLARSHELVVMRSAGVSVWQLLGPPMAIVALIGLLNLLVFNPLTADMYETYQRREDALMRKVQTSLNIGEGGLWLREANGKAASIVHAAEVRQQNGSLFLNAVSIFETDDKETLTRRFEATGGQLLAGSFRLDNVWEMAPGKQSKFHTELSLPTSITSGKIQDSFASPESMSVWDLPHFIRFSQESGFSVLPHRLYWQSLLVGPFMLLTMVLVAAVFNLSATSRAGGWMVRAIAGLAAGFMFYFFNRFTYALGLSSTLPLLLAAWAPTTIVALLGLSYLFHREDG